MIHSAHGYCSPAESSSPVGLLAWRAARAALEDRPTVEISNVDGFTDGVYSAVLPEEGPPMFVRHTSSTRWLYLDSEGRWRVAMTRQKDSRRGGDTGFLRSGTVAPGTLPASASDWELFHPGGWKACKRTIIEGAKHESDWPDLIVTLHAEHGCEGAWNIICTNVAGSEIHRQALEPEKELLPDLRSRLSEMLLFPKKKIKLISTEGKLFSEEDNAEFLSALLPSGAYSLLTEPKSESIEESAPASLEASGAPMLAVC
mmetsp:Transcript_6390/g.10831  ORF Transcript_6390/g.10831 Transcript_6390/m.10831 type:complete len:258 (-) Transcript_6390:106-879(-)